MMRKEEKGMIVFLLFLLPVFCLKRMEGGKRKEQEFLGSCFYANIYEATVTSLRQCDNLKIEVANKANLS